MRRTPVVLVWLGPGVLAFACNAVLGLDEVTLEPGAGGNAGAEGAGDAGMPSTGGTLPSGGTAPGEAGAGQAGEGGTGAGGTGAGGTSAGETSEGGASAGEGGTSAGEGGTSAGGADAGEAGFGTTAGGAAGTGGVSSGGEGGSPVPDSTPPTIVSTTPADGETGVAADQSIVIRFSESMNKVATQSAYQSADIPAANSVLTWNAAGDVLTIVPNDELALGEGTDPASVVAESYTILVTTTAEDLAGNALATDAMLTFSTQRRIIHTLPSVTALTGTVATTAGFPDGSDEVYVGDTLTDGQAKGLVTIDISALPSAIAAWESAMFVGSIDGHSATVYADLGDLNVLQVRFSAVDTTGFSILPLSPVGVLVSETMPSGEGEQSIDALAQLEDDYGERATNGDRSQYRLEFPIPSDNDAEPDTVYMLPANMKIVATYLIE